MAAPSAAPAPAFPQGIEPRHLEGPAAPWRRPLLLAVLVVLPVLIAATGLLGGGYSAHWIAQRDTAAGPVRVLSVETPRVIRSGNWFETRVEIVPPTAVTDLVLAIDDPLWRRMSIDTIAPDAEKSEYKDGAFRLSYGPADAGELKVVKFDGQIQSWGMRGLQGHYRFLDGDREIANVAVSATVLP